MHPAQRRDIGREGRGSAFGIAGSGRMWRHLVAGIVAVELPRVRGHTVVTDQAARLAA